jgi:uncharacterized membrane protein YkvI
MKQVKSLTAEDAGIDVLQQEPSGAGVGVARPISIVVCFGVASVWFGTHVSGGFATGNQTIQYYAQYGITGIFYPLLAMTMLGFALREAIIMAKSRNIYNYHDLFRELWQPFPKLAITFEIFFDIIAVSATGATIAGAASLLAEFSLPYVPVVLVIGLILMLLSIFGANLVIKASTFFSVCILVACISLYFIGIAARSEKLLEVMTVHELPKGIFEPSWKMLVYGSFQAIALPPVIACSRTLNGKRNINTAVLIGILLNGVTTCIACAMLLGWQGEIAAQGNLALPNLYICNRLGYSVIYIFYFVSMFAALISTGVCCTFSLTVRLENSIFRKAAQGTGIMSNIRSRRIVIAICGIAVSMCVSMVGLSNIVKYLYGYCGYLSLVAIIIPLLVIGRWKNKKYLMENPGCLEQRTGDSE